MTAPRRRDAALAALRRPEAALAALVLGACAFFYQAGGWNQNSRFAMVRALVEDGTNRIDRFAGTTGDLSRLDSLVAHADLLTSLRGDVKAYRKQRERLPAPRYCDKAPGVQWLATPAYAAVHAVAGQARPTPAYLAWSAWLATVVAVGVPSALAAAALAAYLRALGLRAGPACGVAAAWSLATLAWPYGTLLYGHQPVAAALVIGFALVATPRARGEAASPRRLAAAGAVLGFAVCLEYPAALACVVIAAYALAVYRWRAPLYLALGAAPMALALAAYHAAAFGSPLALPYDFSTQPHRGSGVFMGIGVPRLDALWGITFSEYRGLFRWTPWLLLAVPGAVVLARAGRRAEVAACAAIAALFLWLNASLVDWQGGWAMGPRYLVPCLPFLAILAAGLARWERPRAWPRRARWAALAMVAALVGYSAVHVAIGTVVKPEVPVTLRRPYQDYLYPALARGEVAISRQRIDQLGEGRARAAWNLGHAVGLTGVATLAPLAAWLAAMGLVVRRRARREVSPG